MVGVAVAVVAYDLLELPATAEALLLARGTASSRSVLLVSGNDARGLVCALLELTDRLLYSDSLTAALNVNPAIVEQPDTTVVIDPGATAVVDGLGNLVISVGAT